MGKAFCKEYDRQVDHHNAQAYLREYQKNANERKEGIFLPEVMEKYHQYQKRRESIKIKL